MAEVRVMVKFKTADIKANLDTVTSLGGSIVHSYHSVNAAAVSISKDKIGALKSNPNIALVEDDPTAYALGFRSSILAQVNPWGVVKIKAPEVHKTGNKGEGIKVSVIDTGIDYNHPNLQSGAYLGGHNYITGTDNPFDDYGHGTHVAGIIAARDTGNGLYGVAPLAGIYAYKVLDSNGSGSYSNIAAAIQATIDKGDVKAINMSLGGSSDSQVLRDMCDAAYNAGIVVCASAGNSGQGTDTIGYPAKYDSVIAIVATDSNDARASFSSTGPAAEIAGPGVSVPSSVPTGSCSLCDKTGIRDLSGTSMSCPHVVGTVALMLWAHPEYTNKEIRSILAKTSVDLGTPGRDELYGWGRVDALAAVGGTPTVTYNCSGAPNYECVAVTDGSGKYPTLEACQAACKESTVTYNCSGAPNYDCVAVTDGSGKYPTLEACQAACKEPPSNIKFMVIPTGSGVVVVKNSFGAYTPAKACEEACRIIKSIT